MEFCKGGQNLGDAVNKGEKEDPIGGGTKGVVGKARLPSYKERSLFMVDHSSVEILDKR